MQQKPNFKMLDPSSMELILDAAKQVDVTVHGMLKLDPCC